MAIGACASFEKYQRATFLIAAPLEASGSKNESACPLFSGPPSSFENNANKFIDFLIGLSCFIEPAPPARMPCCSDANLPNRN